MPENVVEVYANSLQVATTPWDFMWFFGSVQVPETLPIPGNIVPSIRVDVVIRTSPQHAKACLRALETTVKQYEDRFGEIHLPPQEESDADTQTT